MARKHPQSVVVGWLFHEDLSASVYFPPERLSRPVSDKSPPGGGTEGGLNREGAAGCPAITDLAHQFWVIRSPVSLSLRVSGFESGKQFFYQVVPRANHKVLAGQALQRLLQVMPPAAWEHPDRPTLQLSLPYVFVSDESVYVEQFPPFMSDLSQRFPGLIYGGRFPIDVWPRQLNFSFQWLDLEREVWIERGEPLFYVRLLPAQRDRAVRLVEAERTRELEMFMASVRDVTGMVDRSFSLFSRAAELRPPQLVVPKVSYTRPVSSGNV